MIDKKDKNWIFILIVGMTISALIAVSLVVPRYHTSVQIKSIDCNLIECKLLDSMDRGFRYSNFRHPSLVIGETYNITYVISIPEKERSIEQFSYEESELTQQYNNKFKCVDIEGVCK